MTADVAGNLEINRVHTLAGVALLLPDELVGHLRRLVSFEYLLHYLRTGNLSGYAGFLKEITPFLFVRRSQVFECSCLVLAVEVVNAAFVAVICVA